MDEADVASTLPLARRLVVRRARVTVTSGPDRGMELPLLASAVLVGTGESAHLKLSDRSVSKEHLRIESAPSGVRVVDLSSTNGTFCNSARIYDAVLAKDSALSLGNTVLAISISDELLDPELSAHPHFGRAIGHSRAMRQVFAKLEKAAAQDITVLLEGESGTGKDVLASSLHEQSARALQPFVVVDCGALPVNLIESELFGHERGAFTGAYTARAGAFEAAHGGTLFLDEIGELPLDLQPKLLRVLETRSFRRLGGARTIDVDVRVIAATNRDLQTAVQRLEFREDLYYRLAVLRVAVPRLLERQEDIVPLAELFYRRVSDDPEASLPPELLPLLLGYPWPGNVRELRSAVERFALFREASAAVLFGGEPLSRAPSAGVLDLHALDGAPYHEAKRRVMEAFHHVYLERALSRAGGSYERAAQLLEVPRQTLSRLLRGARHE